MVRITPIYKPWKGDLEGELLLSDFRSKCEGFEGTHDRTMPGPTVRGSSFKVDGIPT